MLRIGAHVSISGGFDKAVERQRDLDGNCGQIFAGSPRGWKVTDPPADEAMLFANACEEHDIQPWIIHGTYLINFATPKDDLAEKSIKTVQGEINAADALGIPYYTFHPGAHTGAGEETGITNVADRLSELTIPDGVTVLLENTAGKGTTVGKRMADLAEMVAKSAHDYGDLGVCLDSCHLFSAGYDFTTPDAVDELAATIDDEIGLDNVHYLHLNDSKHPFESEKDEHEHIGEGEIGEIGFELLINHSAFRDLPMVLETPEDDKGYAWNIEKIKSLRDPS